MIQITPHMKILVAIEPVDFRSGIDRLARICREVIDADPLSGAVFVFRSRGGTTIRLLLYDGQGYWLCTKRLSTGKFRWWPSRTLEGTARRLAAHELQVLLWNGDPETTRTTPMWRPLAAAG